MSKTNGARRAESALIRALTNSNCTEATNSRQQLDRSANHSVPLPPSTQGGSLVKSLLIPMSKHKDLTCWTFGCSAT